MVMVKLRLWQIVYGEEDILGGNGLWRRDDGEVYVKR